MVKENRAEEDSFSPAATGMGDNLALHVLHSLDQPLYILDGEDCYLFANTAYAGLYETNPGNLRGRPLGEVVGEAVYGKRMRVLLERARKEGFSEFKGWMEYPGGSRRFMETRFRKYAPPGFEDRHFVLAQSRDITEREEMDQRRRKSLEFQESLLGRVPAMVWMSGRDGKPYFYNDSWLNFTGKTGVEQVRDGWFELVYPEDREGITERIKYAIENGDEVQIEFRLKALKGGYRWVLLSGHPVAGDRERDDEGDYIASALDIDEAKAAQEKIRKTLEEERHLRNEALQQKAEADRANREKSAYLSLASHEIRTPMNPVIGFADLLASNPDLDADSREMAQMILKAGKNLLGLLDEVLDYAKIESGILELSPEPMDIHDLLIEIENLHSFDAKSRGIELRISDTIEGEAEMYQDRLRLQQVIGTLVTNAIKFTHTGHVEVHAEKEADHFQGSEIEMLKISVRDTGLGMSEEEVGRLFKPFSKSESEFSDKYAGTGLGLAITQKLVDVMSGTVSVSSEPGNGTTVDLVIPMNPVPVEMRRKEADLPLEESISSSRSSKPQANVMIADDEASSRKVNTSLMRFLGYQCDEVGNGEALLEKMKEASYEIILVDIMMPGLDGFEVTRRIRNGECGESNREAFIIAVTGCVQEEDRARGYKVGINAYLSKPLTIQNLKETIQSYRAASRQAN
ncbi:MAG: ATP-binding protein [Oceanipulchritudo sp.]